MQTKPVRPDLERYIIRFDRAGHRDELKAAAKSAKRTLNKHLLVLIEAGEKAMKPRGAAQ